MKIVDFQVQLNSIIKSSNFRVISRAFVNAITRSRFIMIYLSSLITVEENLHVYKNTSKLTGKALFEKKKNGFKRISIKFYLFFL